MSLTSRWVLMVVLAVSAVSSADDAPNPRWHRVVGLLQYLEGDYAAALKSQSADELAEQSTMADEVSVTLTQLGAAGEVYQQRAAQLQKVVKAQAPAEEVTQLAREFAQRVVQEQSLSQSPRHQTDLKAAEATWASLCATCHGATGHGDGPAAPGLNPPPANFHDAERMQTLTPYKVFNTTTFGITGTGMVAFGSLSDDERWNLAFYVLSLRQPPCAGAPAKSITLTQLAITNDATFAETVGPEAVACLRRVMPAVDDASQLTTTLAGLDSAVALSKEGAHEKARQAIIDAYLTGFEPLEPALRARNPELLAKVEKGFADARAAAEAGQPIDGEVKALKKLIASTTQSSGTADFWSVFLAALLILIREGFEATVVVGALLALMKKMNATEHVKVVHAGWVTALIFGALAFVFGHAFFAGANREWLETLVALAAVVMLLYAALWLNARANMSKFMTDMREKMKGALGRQSMLGLFMISFSSVGRESIETVLFLEGLAGDSRAGALWGAGAGLMVLLCLVLLVRRVGYVLPMKSLFTASTVVLVVTAIALLGKGIHGLQELGVLTQRPLPFVTIVPLGLFPDMVSLSAQVGLTALVLAYLQLEKRRKARPAV